MTRPLKVGDTITGSGLDGYEIVSVTTSRDIRATRDRLGLSTAELARLVGVTVRTAYKWMEGSPVPEPVWRLLELHQKHQNMQHFFDVAGVDISTGMPKSGPWADPKPD